MLRIVRIGMFRMDILQQAIIVVQRIRCWSLLFNICLKVRPTSVIHIPVPDPQEVSSYQFICRFVPRCERNSRYNSSNIGMIKIQCDKMLFKCSSLTNPFIEVYENSCHCGTAAPLFFWVIEPANMPNTEANLMVQVYLHQHATNNESLEAMPGVFASVHIIIEKRWFALDLSPSRPFCWQAQLASAFTTTEQVNRLELCRFLEVQPNDESTRRRNLSRGRDVLSKIQKNTTRFNTFTVYPLRHIRRSWVDNNRT